MTPEHASALELIQALSKIESVSSVTTGDLQINFTRQPTFVPAVTQDQDIQEELIALRLFKEQIESNY